MNIDNWFSNSLKQLMIEKINNYSNDGWRFELSEFDRIINTWDKIEKMLND